jgi:cell division protein FtsQ
MATARTAALPTGAPRTLRRGRAPLAAAPVEVPADVRWMNAVSAVLAAGLLLGALAAGLLWLTRTPLFTIRAIDLAGDLQRNSVPTIRANAAPRLAGNFFSVDLHAAQAAFETVPWVRSAVVRRVWPDRLLVVLEEHQAAALWEGETTEGSEGSGLERLVNSFGELFDANLGDVEDEALPVFTSPEASVPQALSLLRRVQPAFTGLAQPVQHVAQTRRGSWRVRLEGGAVVELGRGSEDELVLRTERFARTLATATAGWRAPLEYADLRHPGGYAVRLSGVTTGQNLNPRAAAPAARNN